jgi:hypothetical protein
MLSDGVMAGRSKHQPSRHVGIPPPYGLCGRKRVMYSRRTLIRAPLLMELGRIYEDSFKHTAATMSVLDQVAAGLMAASSTTRARIEALLYRGLSQMAERDGLTALLGIGEHVDARLSVRRDEAAPLLGYRSGDSLRQSEQGGRKVTDILLEALCDRILDLAEGCFGLVTGPGGVSIGGHRTDSPDTDPEHTIIDVANGSRMVALTIIIDHMTIFGPHPPDWALISTARAYVSLPKEVSRHQYVSSRLALPDHGTIGEDSAELMATKPFLVYGVKRSVSLYGGGIAYQLTDDIFGADGTPIGDTLARTDPRAFSETSFMQQIVLSVKVITT